MAFVVHGARHRYVPEPQKQSVAATSRKYQITKTDIGLGLVWANAEFCWTSVPKNANMVFRNFLQKIGIPAVPYNHELGLNYNVCVMRDPRTRLISGMGEYCRRQRLENSGPALQTLFETLLNDSSQFDEHLEPQVAFLQGKSYTHILKFENLYVETIQHPYLSSHEPIISRYMNPDRLGNSRHYEHESLEDIYKAHQTVCDDIIDRYYRRDHDIWSDRDSYTGKVI